MLHRVPLQHFEWLSHRRERYAASQTGGFGLIDVDVVPPVKEGIRLALNQIQRLGQATYLSKAFDVCQRLLPGNFRAGCAEHVNKPMGVIAEVSEHLPPLPTMLRLPFESASMVNGALKNRLHAR